MDLIAARLTSSYLKVRKNAQQIPTVKFYNVKNFVGGAVEAAHCEDGADESEVAEDNVSVTGSQTELPQSNAFGLEDKDEEINILSEQLRDVLAEQPRAVAVVAETVGDDDDVKMNEYIRKMSRG